MTSLLAAVERFVLPRGVGDQTLAVLAEAGQKGYEAFVVWGGTLDDERTLRFASAYMPGQQPHRTPEGLAVTLTGEALFRANLAMHDRGEILAAQVHSHPTDAFHSAVDDEYPIVTMLGAISLVVPDFAAAGWGAYPQWAWYRLVGQQQFAPLSPSAVEVTHDPGPLLRPRRGRFPRRSRRHR